MIRLGIIGNGAVVQQLHLPAIARVAEVKATWIVDIALNRAAAFAQEYQIPNVADDYTQVRDVDAVLIATPHYLHAPMTEFFLNRGAHVLCEKPLAIGARDAENLVALAKTKRRVLAVGVFRRYYPISAMIRRMLKADWLGQVERIDAEEGFPYEWDLQSRFMMERAQAGGGVLVDTGSHTVDRILWWLGGVEAQLESYSDNSYGGVETDCEIRFSVPCRGRSIAVRVELSRTRALRNTFQIFTARGMIEAPVNAPHAAWFTDQRLGNAPIRLEPDDSTASDISAYFTRQLRDFCDAITNGNAPLNAGETVLPTVRLIDVCYAHRAPLAEPWVSLEQEHALLEN